MTQHLQPAGSSRSGAVAPPVSTAHAVGNTIKGSLGNLVEWYDVYTYTVFASYFEAKFFNPDDRDATFYVYAIFAVTFIMRPFGSWFFGRYADRHGRRAALTMSVTIMAAASAVIAILPTRGSIGVWAAVLLLLCRLVQGFATGGEYGTSATYMSEAATRGLRGFFSSFQYVTLVGGQVVAQLVLLIMTFTMSEADIKNWGWRVAFGIGGVAALVVLWLRRTMDESLSKEHLEAVATGKDNTSGTLSELFSHHWKPLLLCFLITMGGTVAFYTYSVNAPAIIKATFKSHPSTATWLNLAALVLLMLLQPVGGLISDKVGRKPLLIWFGAGGLVWTYVLLTYLPKASNPLNAFLLLAVGFIFLTGYTSINALVKSELFPARIRALGVGLGYGLANSVFGGTAPMIYQYAKEHKQVPMFIWYVTACVFVSLLVYVFALRNKSETHLDREQGHAYDLDRPIGGGTRG